MTDTKARTPEEQRNHAAETYLTAAVAARELARVLNARALAILATDHARSLHLAHDMIDAERALRRLMFEAQDEHGESLRADHAHFLALASGPVTDEAEPTP